MWTDELKVASHAIKFAQEEILRYYGQDIRVDYKNQGEPVTSADIKSEEIMHKYISSEFPDDGWLSEESTQNPSLALKKKRIWVVDPLDGTQDFIQKTGDFSICVAFLVDIQPIFSLIVKPTENKLYQAIYKEGVTCNGQAIRVSSIKNQEKIRITVSKTDPRRERLEGCFPDWLKGNIVRIGSTALKIASVAEGAVEGFYCPWQRNIWDYSAARLILEEAGGRMTDLSGNEINKIALNVPNLLVTNGLTHEILLQFLGGKCLD
ncbi:MAG: inositol monophosphatase family protein [Promethearchaeota archaeon]